jgi:hypothetical protein
MNRTEHLAWAKTRALEYVARGELGEAYLSFRSDMNKHEELREHPRLVARRPAVFRRTVQDARCDARLERRVQLMSEEHESARDYASLYIALCTCAGPQPSRMNARADEHGRECPYRREVEGEAEEVH